MHYRCMDLSSICTINIAKQAYTSSDHLLAKFSKVRSDCQNSTAPTIATAKQNRTSAHVSDGFAVLYFICYNRPVAAIDVH